MERKKIIRHYITLFACLSIVYNTFAQVGIGTTTPHVSAALDVSFDNKGVLFPRVSLTGQTDKTTIPNPATGLLVYNTNAAMTNAFGVGFYYNSGTPEFPVWTRITTGGSTLQSWLVQGNSGTNANNDFIGTTDLTPLVFKTNNIQSGRLDPILRSYFLGQNAGLNNVSGQNNVAIGQNALRVNTTKSSLVAVGSGALENNGTSATLSTQGVQNTAVGFNALNASTTASYNTAVGTFAMEKNTTGSSNTALGAEALRNNITGQRNSALGHKSLQLNTGSHNTAVGSEAMSGNIGGSNNSALGANALSANTSGNDNTAIGYRALGTNATGSENVAIGVDAYRNAEGGSQNTAVGFQAMQGNTPGNSNGGVAIGYRALLAKGTGANNTAVGTEALENATGGNNVGVGYRAGRAITTGTNNTAIGNNATISATVINATAIGNGATVTASNTIRIGNNSVFSIGGFAAWTNLSDGRAKKDIVEQTPGLSFIMGLRPVSYLIDPIAAAKISGMHIDDTKAMFTPHNNTRHIGFIAQEVDDLVQKIGIPFDVVDKPLEGNGPLGLRYALFVVPLVKAVQTQQNQLNQLEAEAKALQQQIKEQLERLGSRQSGNSFTN
jgi:trimeric autotransporter adhesin